MKQTIISRFLAVALMMTTGHLPANACRHTTLMHH